MSKNQIFYIFAVHVSGMKARTTLLLILHTTVISFTTAHAWLSVHANVRQSSMSKWLNTALTVKGESVSLASLAIFLSV